MNRRHVRDLTAIFRAGVAAVQAPALLAETDLASLAGRPLDAFGRVAVLGVGKAAAAMGAAFEARYDGLAFTGFVTVPHGHAGTAPRLRQLTLVEAGHPVPDAASARAATEALACAASLSADDLLVVLVSGGGSALWAAPVSEAVGMGDLQHAGEVLLRSGLPIAALNAVRKRLTRLSAGRLAAAAFPARVVALVLSDVEGDDPATVASGPTVGTGSDRDGMAALRASGVWAELPVRVRAVLDAPPAGTRPLRPDDPRLRTTRTIVVGTNARARVAAARAAEACGWHPHVQDDFLSGPADAAGRHVARAALAAARSAHRPVCLVWGGETTVRVTGAGKGGRNQEMALAAAEVLAVELASLTLLFAGTDGRDGPTDAAGAFCDPALWARALAAGRDPARHLAGHDAYPLLDALGALLRTGPTHTNVMDLALALVEPH